MAHVWTASQFVSTSKQPWTDLPIRQRIDYHAQRRKRFVDLLRFFQSLTRRSSLTDLYVSFGTTSEAG